MRSYLTGCAAVIALSTGPPVYAATVTSTFSNTYTTSQSLFGGNSSSSFDFNVDLGIVEFNADANSGTVNSTVRSNHALYFNDSLTLSAASTAQFRHRVTDLRSGFNTAYGATATATAGIDGFSFNIIDEGASVATSRTNVSASFGSAISDTDRDALVGRELPIPIISPVVAATINLEQRSTQKIDRVTGVIRAAHESGTVVSRSYSRNSFSSDNFALNLGLVGSWDIFALNMDALGTFDADFGTSSTGTVGYRIGFNCGDVTDDGDNGFGCASDGGASITTPVAYVKNGTPFGLNFGQSSSAKNLGSITVVADPVVQPPSAVPLPAGALDAPVRLWRSGGYSAAYIPS